MSALRTRVAAAMSEGATVAQADELIVAPDLEDEEREAVLWLYAWSLARGTPGGATTSPADSTTGGEAHNRPPRVIARNMADQPQPRQTHDGAALKREQAAADRYDRRQHTVHRGGGDGGARGPLEFDERGFPLPQRTPSYIERVTRRLLDSR